MWLAAQVEFDKMKWEDLKEGDLIYYWIDKKHLKDEAFGPITVVDPKLGKVKNRQGVVLALPHITPLKAKV